MKQQGGASQEGAPLLGIHRLPTSNPRIADLRKRGSTGDISNEKLKPDSLQRPQPGKFLATLGPALPETTAHTDTSPTGEADSMVTDDDIVRMLKGEPSRESERARDRITEALEGKNAGEAQFADRVTAVLEGRPTDTQQAANRAIAREISGTPQAAMGLGVSQPDDYISQLGLEAAKASLRNRLMAADPTLTAGAAEFRVEVAADAAYSAAEKHRYEADRLDSVTEALKARAHKVPTPKPTVPTRNANTIERRTYTTLDGKVTAVFEGPPGRRRRRLIPIIKTTALRIGGTVHPLLGPIFTGRPTASSSPDVCRMCIGDYPGNADSRILDSSGSTSYVCLAHEILLHHAFDDAPRNGVDEYQAYALQSIMRGVYRPVWMPTRLYARLTARAEHWARLLAISTVVPKAQPLLDARIIRSEVADAEYRRNAKTITD